jgi:predicted deacylase
MHDLKLSCDTALLNLAQATAYELRLVRSFGGVPANALLTGSVQTVAPVVMTASSVPPGGVVYDVPSAITITFDKPLADSSGVSLMQAGGAAVAFTPSNSGNQLVLTLAQPLARQTSFELRVQDVRATDKGYLAAPIVIGFNTSGGPRVVGKSIGTSSVASDAVIRLTFDSPLAAGEAAKFIQLVGIPASITSSGNVATISPSRNFERCEAFSVRVLDGLPNAYSVTGGSAYTLNSRALCRSTFSIGTSAEGRAITAYKFGSGPSIVLYVGATHGNELSSKYILDSWVQHLEGIAPSIPAHRSVVVIPSLNPDGIARVSRTNARGVDLNRNFPANNWKADVTLPGGQLVPNGGGTAPLSEPESAALASYTQSVRPRLVLTYHSKASIVTANESGDSMALAVQYGQAAGYRAVAESQLGGTFNYDTTGAYENWLHDKVGIPTLLIELPGNTANYFSRNRAPMWSMVNL